MRLGVSGHRRREHADWLWVRDRMADIIFESRRVVGYASLAVGADQLFAETVLAYGRKLVSVIPVHHRAEQLAGIEERRFRALRSRSSRVVRVAGRTPDEAYLRAGMRVCDSVDRMIFVWDGGPPLGLGGTADIVDYALKTRRPGIIIDPIEKRVRTL